MRDTLFIRLGLNTSYDVSWIHSRELDEPGAIPAVGSLEQAAMETPGNRVIVLVPTVDVLLTSVIVPSRNRQRIISAVPYLLEDQIAVDVDSQHFAIGKRDNEGLVNVAVVDHKKMDAWIEALRSVNIEPDMLVPDVLALPAEENAWTFIEEPGTAMMCTGSQTGSSIDIRNAEFYLQRMLEESGENKPGRLRIYECNAETGNASIDFSSMDIDVNANFYDATPFVLLAKSFNESAAINLLQGSYSRREKIGRALRMWRPALGMAAILLLLIMGNMISDYYSLSQEKEMLTRKIENIYRETFPDEKNVPKPRIQMERHLKKLRGGQQTDGGGFLDLLANTGAPMNATKGLDLNRISYRDGELDMMLIMQDVQSLDKLKEQLISESGLDVDIQSATARDNKVEARLKIKRAGS